MPLNGRPMVHEMSIVPMILAADLGSFYQREPLRPLYATLDEAFSLREVRSDQSLVSRPADKTDRRLLNLAKSDWVVEVAGISYSNRNLAFDRFRMIFEARGFSFKLGTTAASAFAAVEVER